jgi:hypothetical protein
MDSYHDNQAYSTNTQHSNQSYNQTGRSTQRQADLVQEGDPVQGVTPQIASQAHPGATRPQQWPSSYHQGYEQPQLRPSIPQNQQSLVSLNSFPPQPAPISYPPSFPGGPQQGHPVAQAFHDIGHGRTFDAYGNMQARPAAVSSIPPPPPGWQAPRFNQNPLVQASFGPQQTHSVTQPFHEIDHGRSFNVYGNMQAQIPAVGTITPSSPSFPWLAGCTF